MKSEQAQKKEPKWPWMLKTPRPRGLAVLQILRDKSRWADPKVPEYLPNFYYRFLKKGLPVRLRAIENPNITTLKQAQEFALTQMKAATMPQVEALRAAVAGTTVQRQGCTYGQFLTAFEAVAKARKLKQWERCRNSLRLIVAIVHDIMPPLAKIRLDRDGGVFLRKVDALPLALSDELAMEYAKRMQVAATILGEGFDYDDVAEELARRLKDGAKINLDKALPPAINGTINSTLANARVMLSKQNRMMELAALAVDWPRAEGFGRLVLPEMEHDVGADIPTQEQYGKMYEAWETLRKSRDEREREKALVNELLRLLGVRSGELAMARESWLFAGAAGRDYLWVKNRPEEGFSCKSSNAAKLPLSAELAGRLRARCEAAKAGGMENPFLILPMLPAHAEAGKELVERQLLVRDEHNTWLKQYIGEVKSRQGNHRLRKYCATALYAAEMRAHGDHAKAANVVKEYLRHSKEATALLHYIARNDEKLPTMTDEHLSAAWV